MKKTILTVLTASSMLAVSGYSQGVISFSNNGSTLVTMGMGGPAEPITTTSGAHVQLFYQPNANGSTAPIAMTMENLGNWEGISTLASIAPLAGRFNVGNVTTGNDIAPAGNGYFEVVGWTGNFTTLQQAIAGGASSIGFSTVWAEGTGDGNTVNANPIYASGFNGLALVPVPEPTTIVLGGLGAAALLAFRRRK